MLESNSDKKLLKGYKVWVFISRSEQSQNKAMFYCIPPVKLKKLENYKKYCGKMSVIL